MTYKSYFEIRIYQKLLKRINLRLQGVIALLDVAPGKK